MKTTDVMTTESAVYCLRREPQSDMERRACVAALECLGSSGVPLREVEGDVMRKLTTDELAIFNAAR